MESIEKKKKNFAKYGTAYPEKEFERVYDMETGGVDYVSVKDLVDGVTARINEFEEKAKLFRKSLLHQKDDKRVCPICESKGMNPVFEKGRLWGFECRNENCLIKGGVIHGWTTERKGVAMIGLSDKPEDCINKLKSLFNPRKVVEKKDDYTIGDFMKGQKKISIMR